MRSLGREDPLEKDMATHSGALAWRIPWTEELGWPQSIGCKSQTRFSTIFLQPEFLAELTARPGPRRPSWEAAVHWAPKWVGAARGWVALASVSPSADEKGWIQSVCSQIPFFFQWFYSNWLTKKI